MVGGMSHFIEWSR